MHGYNLFVYCNNNPVNYVDYTGKNPFAVLIATNPYLAAATVLLVVVLGIIAYDATHDQVIANTISNAVDSVLNHADEKKKEGSLEDPPQSLDEAEKTSSELPNQGKVSEVPGAPPVDAGKQGKHVPGHNNNNPNKSQWPIGENGVKQTQEAWQNGSVDPNGNPYGSVRKGFANDGTFVRVHMGADGSIHGYPIFP